MESLDVFTQAQLEEALGRPGVIPVCSGDGAFEVIGDEFVRAADSARVAVQDSVAIEAGAALATNNVPDFRRFVPYGLRLAE